MKPLDPTCCHNVGVLCSEIGRDCIKCGWHPCEAKRRKEEIRKMEFPTNPTGKFFLTLKGDENA